MLSLHRLILEFTSELSILYYCQFRSSNQLVLIHIQHLDFDCPDLQKHLFPQVVNLVDFILLDWVKNSLVSILLCLNVLTPQVGRVLNLYPMLFEFLQVLDLSIHLSNLLLEIINFWLIFFMDPLYMRLELLLFFSFFVSFFDDFLL